MNIRGRTIGIALPLVLLLAAILFTEPVSVLAADAGSAKHSNSSTRNEDELHKSTVKASNTSSVSQKVSPTASTSTKNNFLSSKPKQTSSTETVSANPGNDNGQDANTNEADGGIGGNFDGEKNITMMVFIYVFIAASVFMLAFFVYRAITGKMKRKTKRYGEITVVDMEMAPLGPTDDDDDDTTVFEVRKSRRH